MFTPSENNALDAVTAVLWKQLLSDLQLIKQQHPDATFANSLAAEDMVLQHAIATHGLNISSFTLDTGRLHKETLALLDVINSHYGIQVTSLKPNQVKVDQHVAEHGAYAFYESLELRKACCGLRKVEPLRAYLQGKSAWITGQRREQSQTRSELQKNEFDSAFQLQKFNPLCDWTLEQVWTVIRTFAIPYNSLHDQNYPSIGCDPCTRAIRAGEDVRAGRWWWEQRDSIECGLHQSPTTATTENT
ncbi:phosphoadenylyl-sulfate reductase [Paenalcaligenes niemegkensis]|uniref:phosphoadenylyl-sulfate reductase n=1 Tax=Paenalcaligenes niemegkensis TaxID=2895469 RepID=UPI001EE9A07D|nr:phosphoadenylyl-sulfate reductase [Paenalcaligenes niemegkensis]MCQ9615326.1 phosphoadenylyl-sulfate reductase [Paenalcaligenes niemegkensis]